MINQHGDSFFSFYYGVLCNYGQFRQGRSIVKPEKLVKLVHRRVRERKVTETFHRERSADFDRLSNTFQTRER